MKDKSENMKRGPLTPEEMAKHRRQIEGLTSGERQGYLKDIAFALNLITQRVSQLQAEPSAQQQETEMAYELLLQKFSQMAATLTALSAGNISNAEQCRALYEFVAFFRAHNKSTEIPVLSDAEILEHWHTIKMDLVKLPLPIQSKQAVTAFFTTPSTLIRRRQFTSTASANTVWEVTDNSIGRSRATERDPDDTALHLTEAEVFTLVTALRGFASELVAQTSLADNPQSEKAGTIIPPEAVTMWRLANPGSLSEAITLYRELANISQDLAHYQVANLILHEYQVNAQHRLKAIKN